MDSNFASNQANNPYFDRIIQTQVENDLRDISYCLQMCNISHRAHSNPEMSFQQRLCLSNFLII